MQINKRSWHYAIYKSTYSIWGEKPPESSNLCQYMRRLLTCWLWYGMMAVFFTTYFVVAVPVGFVFGGKPNWFINDKFDPFTKYEGWKVVGIALYPWMALVPALLVWLNVFAATSNGGNIFFWTEAGLVGLIVFVFGLVVVSTSDFDLVVSAWVDGKKNKVCPLVDFVDEDKSK